MPHPSVSRGPRAHPPSRTATAANATALLALALACAGFGGLHLDWLAPLVAQGMLIVAIGAAIVGTTLSAIGLLTTRPGRDRVGRRRAWVGAGLSVTLLLTLIAAFQLELRGPVVVEGAMAPSGVVRPA